MTISRSQISQQLTGNRRKTMKKKKAAEERVKKTGALVRPGSSPLVSENDNIDISFNFISLFICSKRINA